MKDPSGLLLLSIVTVNADVHKTTANLQGPIAINIQACLGRQIICEGQHHPLRHKIWDALNDFREATIEAEKKRVLAK